MKQPNFKINELPFADLEPLIKEAQIETLNKWLQAYHLALVEACDQFEHGYSSQEIAAHALFLKALAKTK